MANKPMSGKKRKYDMHQIRRQRIKNESGMGFKELRETLEFRGEDKMVISKAEESRQRGGFMLSPSLAESEIDPESNRKEETSISTGGLIWGRSIYGRFLTRRMGALLQRRNWN